MLCEMLSGEAPYTAPTPQALIAKKPSEPTPRISVVREAVPAGIEAALTKALAKTPVDRFATAQQFVQALATPSGGISPGQGAPGTLAERRGRMPAWQWGAGVLVAVVVVAVGTVLKWGGQSGADAEVGEEEVRRIVVPPFQNRTGDPTAADWGLMAAEYVTRAIDRAGVVTVAPASVVRDLLWEVDPAVGLPVGEIAGRTEARYAVVGSYTVSAGRLRFDVELVDAGSGEMLRALDPVSGPVDSLESVVTVLAERVTAAAMALLNPDLGPEFAQWSSPPSLEVFRGLMAVQDVFCRGRWQDAINQAQPALSEAPDFAPLLILAFISYTNLGRTREADSVLTLIDATPAQKLTHRTPDSRPSRAVGKG